MESISPDLRLPLRTTLVLAFLGALAAASAQTFVEATSEAQLGYVQRDISDPTLVGGAQVMTGGAAAADYDGDGWTDLYVTRIDDTDILFRNQGDGTFEDVSTFTENAPTNGAAWGDIDNDGDQDLYVSVVGTTLGSERYFLYINGGDGSFSEQGQAYGADLFSNLGHNGFSVGFGDYNRDGWIDAHTCEWLPKGGNKQSKLLMNSGPPNFFSDVTVASGVQMWWSDDPYQQPNVDAFSARFCDIDGDGWQDLVVAADFGTSQLFWNNQDGTFTNGTVAAGLGLDENGMGLAIGDYDNDGLLDIFVTAIYDERDVENLPGNWQGSGNRLYRNRGDRTFEDATDVAGVRAGGWGWGAVFFDYDNDADLDLLMTNGFITAFASSELPFHTDPTILWRNDGGIFTDVTTTEGITDTASGKGTLVFDYDRDGDLDVFITNNAGQPVFYKNTTANGNHWLRVKTTGSVSNRDGIGAKISIEPRGLPLQVREVSGGNQYLSQNEKICHFGLEDLSTVVDQVTIDWPSGIRQVYKDVPVDSLLHAIEPSSHFEGWQQLEFTTEELGKPSICSALADPDPDRLTNLIEFATGLPAQQGNPEGALTLSTVPESQLLEVKYRRRQFLGEVSLALEISNDLQSWRAGEAELLTTEVEPDGPGFEIVTLRSTSPLPQDGPLGLYIRLVASIGN